MATALKSTSHRPKSLTKKTATKIEKASERPIWETVAELGAQISDEEWEKFPQDSSINFKSYADSSVPRRA